MVSVSQSRHLLRREHKQPKKLLESSKLSAENKGSTSEFLSLSYKSHSYVYGSHLLVDYAVVTRPPTRMFTHKTMKTIRGVGHLYTENSERRQSQTRLCGATLIGSEGRRIIISMRWAEDYPELVMNKKSRSCEMLDRSRPPPSQSSVLNNSRISTTGVTLGDMIPSRSTLSTTAAIALLWGSRLPATRVDACFP